MNKDCMKIAKSTYFGQNSGLGGDQLIFWVVRAFSPSLMPHNSRSNFCFSYANNEEESYLVLNTMSCLPTNNSALILFSDSHVPEFKK